ncbi:MAG: Uma2 family endonuclease [Planctomycetes bacterium]|nr:Uma2 family endonuclease [Planctomycetota bacterium]
MTTQIATISPPTSTKTRPDLYRLSVEQYHQMISAGILTENDRVQLIEGALFEMSAMGTRHVMCIKLINQSLTAILPDGWHVGTQQPVTMQTSEPEPDLVVIRGQIRDFTNRHPAGPDVGLVIEVADTSLQMDREQKLPVYAQAGIAEYWVVNLNDNTIEVFRNPQPGSESNKAGYQSQKILSASDKIAVALGDQSLGELKVSDLLP